MFDSEYFKKHSHNGSACRYVVTDITDEVRKPKCTPCSASGLRYRGIRTTLSGKSKCGHKFETATICLQSRSECDIPLDTCSIIFRPFIHSAICLKTVPQHHPNRVLHTKLSSASSFSFTYPLIS